MKVLFIFTISIFLFGCGHFNRHTKSGYYDYSDGSYIAKNHFDSKKQYEFQLAKEQLGYSNKDQLNETEWQKVLQQVKLQQLERQLITQRQKKQYYEHKPFMTSRQMNEYLTLNSEPQRKSYLIQNNIQSPSMENYPAEISELIEGNEIALGMTKQMVTQSWGEPDQVEYAGNSVYQNEKWSYRTTSPSLNGYVHENRVILFESGRVAGWTKE